MNPDAALEALLEAFPGAEVHHCMPPIVQCGPVGSCVHCGRMCATLVRGHNRVIRRRHGPFSETPGLIEYWPEEDLMPLHVACADDYLAGRVHADKRPPVGLYARRQAASG